MVDFRFEKTDASMIETNVLKRTISQERSCQEKYNGENNQGRINMFVGPRHTILCGPSSVAIPEIYGGGARVLILPLTNSRGCQITV